MARITDDPVRDAEAWIREQDKVLERRPRCSYCDEPIIDDWYYDIEGEIICQYCVEDRKRRVDDDC